MAEATSTQGTTSLPPGSSGQAAPPPPPPAAAAAAATASRATPANSALLALPRHAPPEGEVLREHKNLPVHELPPQVWPQVPLCRKRGQVCVADLKRKLATGGERLWLDEEARKHNVGLTRPSHDAWGIKKIVFVYCDDFLRRCFEMPWLHDPEWRALLLPVFEALGVPVHKVVRCLLASMPPGIAIPPHHDTGYWVHHTHRIHVPVVTDPAYVAFRVGPTNDRLARYDMPEGCLVELNNQAKHTVDNCWDRHRVHLIFDYLEGENWSIERCRLTPGTKVHQTRRTIDLHSEVGTRPCPSYVILGAQKCGTTSMYEYLCQHPLVLRARRRETHYLDWRWRPEAGLSTEEHLVTYHRFFYKTLLDENPSCLTGESTPSYLLHSDLVLPRVKALAPEAKLIVMLRDPVARAYSQYQMVVDPEGTPEQKKARGTHWVGKTFAEVVEAELADLAQHGITPDTSYAAFRDQYLASRPQGYGSHSLLARGLYALQLLPWLAAFPREQLLVLFMEDMKTPAAAHTQVGRVFDFLGLPPHRIIDTEAKNTRAYVPLDAATKERLATFYAPFNRQLFALLGREMTGWATPSSSSAAGCVVGGQGEAAATAALALPMEQALRQLSVDCD